MYTPEFAKAYVKFLSTKDENGQTWLDKCFTLKKASDKDGNQVNKVFLSADSRYVYKNPKEPIIIHVGGKDVMTTQVEIPAVILRNIQSPEQAIARAEQRTTSRALTQTSNVLDKVSAEDMTPEQRNAAVELFNKLKGIVGSDAGEPSE